MSPKTLVPALALFALALAAPAPLPPDLAAAQDGAGALDAVPVPDSITARGVPALPRAEAEGLLPYENLRTALLVGWHPRERRLLVRTRFAETTQLHEVAMPMGARTQLTFFGERVTGGAWRPGDPSQLVFQVDPGGSENFQLYLLDLDTGRTRLLTDGEHRHDNLLWSRGGKLLAYTGNARNGRDADLYVMDPAAPGSARRVAELPGAWMPLDWSHDDRRLLLSEYISANESYLHWVDVATGERHRITPPAAPGAPPAAWRGGRWSPDGRAVYATTDREGEFLRLVRLDLAGRQEAVLSGDVPWDVERLEVSDDGALLAFFVNAEGKSELRLLDLATGKALPTPELPAGVANELAFRPGGRELAFDLEWARSPTDVYTYDPGSRRLERWTMSETGGLPRESFVVPRLFHYPTFDEALGGGRRMIPAYVYQPPADRFPGKRPVYVNIHGGPEGQFRPDFLGSENYVAAELGVAMIYPNVRGSSGYGKTYLQLDNGTQREDSVKDIGALLDWIAAQPDLDPGRVMVAGGSYGGYMVLASMVHFGDRLRCGYDSVGISDFVTFLENTQEYRRDLRRVEYGDERDPEMRAFLQRIAPARQADRIRRPLLVAQGANDPRVPLSESDQIVAAVEKSGAPVWYLVAKDEGHGFRKKTNSDYLRVVLFEFVERCLLGRGEL